VSGSFAMALSFQNLLADLPDVGDFGYDRI